MITHPPLPADDIGGVVLFAELLGVTCSICAPVLMSQDEVEAAATLLVAPKAGPWRAVDKSKPPISIGGPTPNPCNVYHGRTHWFLISGEF